MKKIKISLDDKDFMEVVNEVLDEMNVPKGNELKDRIIEVYEDNEDREAAQDILKEKVLEQEIKFNNLEPVSKLSVIEVIQEIEDDMLEDDMDDEYLWGPDGSISGHQYDTDLAETIQNKLEEKGFEYDGNESDILNFVDENIHFDFTYHPIRETEINFIATIKPTEAILKAMGFTAENIANKELAEENGLYTDFILEEIECCNKLPEISFPFKTTIEEIRRGYEENEEFGFEKGTELYIHDGNCFENIGELKDNVKISMKDLTFQAIDKIESRIYSAKDIEKEYADSSQKKFPLLEELIPDASDLTVERIQEEIQRQEELEEEGDCR